MIISMGFSIVNLHHPFLGYPYFRKAPQKWPLRTYQGCQGCQGLVLSPGAGYARAARWATSNLWMAPPKAVLKGCDQKSGNDVDGLNEVQ